MTHKKLVGRAAVAKHFGVHPQTVADWVADGCPTAARGKGPGHPHLYDLSAVEAWRRALAATRQDGEALSLEAERAALAKVQRERVELQNATRRGELLPLAEVAAACDEILMAVRARLLAIPSGAAERGAAAAGSGGPKALEVVLKQAVRDALTELAMLGEVAPGRNPPEQPKRPKRP